MVVRPSKMMRQCRSSLTTQEICLPFEDRLPKAAALLPWTSELGEFVKGISTSQMPISNNCPFSSSAHRKKHVDDINGQDIPLNARTAMHAVISL